jgi:hypothetical protein
MLTAVVSRPHRYLTEGLRPNARLGDLRSARWQGRETLPQRGDFRSTWWQGRETLPQRGDFRSARWQGRETLAQRGDFGRPGGKVGRPCHNALTAAGNLGKLFPSHSLLDTPAPIPQCVEPKEIRPVHVERPKRLLACTDLAVYAIADGAGLSNANHLSTLRYRPRLLNVKQRCNLRWPLAPKCMTVRADVREVLK